MKEIKKLLVIIDPDVKNDFVIERARLLATAFRPEVELYINRPSDLKPKKRTRRQFFARLLGLRKPRSRRHYQQRLSALQQQFDGLGIEVRTTFTEYRHTADSILQKILDYEPDLALKSVQKQTALSRILITSTDWKLIKQSPAPLWLVKSGKWEPDGCTMAAVDPMHTKAQQNELDHLLLDAAQHMARGLGLKTRVFHCYFPDVSAMFPKVLDAADYIRGVRARHKAKIEELLTRHNLEVSDVILTRGDLVRTLQHSIRREKANVLVLGALSRNFVERTIVGSTAEKMLYDTNCDVLIMKSPPPPAATAT